MIEVKSGNLDKLGLLFERYNRKLFSYFYRLTYCSETSEDLVQSVFERIIKYRHTYEKGHAFSTWIYRIARNIHVDYYRDKHQQKRSLKALDFNRLESTPENSGVDFQQNNRLKLLQKALNKLEPVKKETLILSRFQGFKYKEIARIMECSESAVKVRIFRAINELKEITSELMDNNDYE